MDDTNSTIAVLHADLAMARRLERAEGLSNADFVDARRHAFPEIGGEWIQVAGAHAMFDGVDSPCTQTFGLGLFESATDADLISIEQFFDNHGSDVFHEVCPIVDVSLLARLSERGYRPIELSTVLVRPLHRGAATQSPVESLIRARLIETTEHDLWARVAAEGWADVALGFEDFLLTLGRVNPHRETAHCFLATCREEPIAAGAICVCESVALLAGASTIPKWRGQGAQTALLEARIRFAAESGCDIAMIVTQPGSASQRNAERQGFHVAYTRTKWRRPCASA